MKKFWFLAAISVLLISCGKDPQGGDEGKETKEVQCNLKGYAQKGQFIKGSQVTAFAVGADMVATGESFPANISDDLGTFAITGKTEAPYLELRAEGYYFNEVTGEVSSSPMYLEAFVKSNDTAANINLFTTIIRPRVKKLIAGGATYEKAVEQAQKELLSSKYVTDMGFSGSVNAFDELDITGQSDADGILLALACKVLNQRTASQVTTLVQELASELEEEGKISYMEMVNSGFEVQPFSVMSNMANYYAEKKLNITTIPPFHKYFGEQYQKPFLIVENGAIDVYNPAFSTPDERNYGFNILATEEFTVESNLADAVIEKKHIIGPAYYVTCTIPANEGADDRDYTITFKDASGKELDSREGTQGGNVQYLLIQYATSTKSDITVSDGTEGNPFEEGVEVSVNGKTYSLERLDALYGELGVKVAPAESYIVSYPAGKVSSGGHIAKVQASVAADQTSGQQMYFYGALAPYEGLPIGNPARVQMKMCLSVIRIRPDNEYCKIVEISSADGNGVFSGTASFVVDEQDKYYFSDLNPDLEPGADASATIRADYNPANGYVQFMTFPQQLEGGLKIKWVVEVDGATTENVKVIENITQLRAGTLYNFKM